MVNHGENLKKVHPIDTQGEGYIGDRRSFKYEIIEESGKYLYTSK